MPLIIRVAKRLLAGLPDYASGIWILTAKAKSYPLWSCSHEGSDLLLDIHEISISWVGVSVDLKMIKR